MKNINGELIEKLTQAAKNGLPEISVLYGADDGRYYYALSPERYDLLDSMPLYKDMDVLVTGAVQGAYIPLSERVRSVCFEDTDEDQLEIVRLRAKRMLFENGGNISLRLMNESAGQEKFDAVISVITERKLPDAFGSFKELSDYAFSKVKDDGIVIIAADNAMALKFMTDCVKNENSSYITEEEVNEIISAHGDRRVREYYPLPGAAFARNIFSDSYMPRKGDFKGVSESYTDLRSRASDEAYLYESFAKEGMFRKFAPSYMLVFTNEKKFAELPVYSRFNMRRDEKYAAKTDLFEKNGIRSARKTSLSRAANEHIENFKIKYELLSENFEGMMHVLEPIIHRDGARSYANFEFIEGKTLAAYILDTVKDGKPDKDIIDENIALLMGRDKACYNLDCLFENVIVNENGKYLIDYEWTFMEGVNPAFLRYRILSYFYDAHRNLLYAYKNKKSFLNEFGIDADAASFFENKENSFQQAVIGNYDTALEKKFLVYTKDPGDVSEDSERMLELTEWNLRLQDEIEEQKTVLMKEREVERLSQNHIRNIEKMNSDQKMIIESMEKELSYLRTHQSIFSRIRNAFIRRLDKWAPAESRKRKLIKYTKNTILHPVKYLKMYFSKEGKEFIHGDFAIGGEFAEEGRLTVKGCAEPLVSIVIPVYDQVGYTYACIRSIIHNTDMEETPYEIILADDVSKDATAELGNYITGITVSRNTENTGFLKNCNQGAEKARGKYIFFLNNDTKVNPGWLSSLVYLMENDDTIGMAGSKLLYPDGRLQEAGGIIWSDASGWNYGRLDDPEKPEYNYVKDVDYISGAAIMIRHDLWIEIGGFDERYAPAYCEDSDLAFEVRKHGKRVVYQPLSEVIHFEGISNGTDVEGTGLKRYQKENQEKLKEKWAEELKNQETNTGNPDPFTARERTGNKKCIVVIDHYVPTWDKDAGSKTTFQYIRMFLEKGYNVKFIGDNFIKEEPYTTTLMQMGVEVLYGKEYENRIFDWFADHKDKIDIVYLNRPHIAVKYIDFLKKNTGIKCIFYGHDLHYLRLLREYELSGEIRKKRESDYWKGLEFSVMEKADMVYYPSSVEKEAIERLHPEITAKAITAYVWDEFVNDAASEEDYEKREGLLFVGGFSHPPNEDGVRWFIEEVWPKIKEAIPEMTFRIVGSNAPDAIKALAEKTDGVELLGYVSDEKLTELYNTSRMVAVPLRYGAGVKGKVVEALYNGNAIVTTPVGAEGICNAGKAMIIADEADFAKAVIVNYRDAKRLSEMSREALQTAKENYSTEAVWDRIKDDF